VARAQLNLPAMVKRLEALKLELRTTVESVKDASKPVELDQNKVGRLSRMDAMQGQAIASASAQRQFELLQRIEHALKEIESGEYGRCIDSDEQIARARLIADPVAQTCIVCATRIEQR